MLPGFITTYSDLHKQILTKVFLAGAWKCMMIYNDSLAEVHEIETFSIFLRVPEHAVTTHLLNGVYELFISSI